jgi:hypothetical protein
MGSRRHGELLERLSKKLRETRSKRTTRIFIVEDDDPIANAITRLLGTSFEIVRALDGVAARDPLIAGASFDFILSPPLRGDFDKNPSRYEVRCRGSYDPTDHWCARA